MRNTRCSILDTKSTTKDAKDTEILRRGLTLIDADIILTAEDAEHRGA